MENVLKRKILLVDDDTSLLVTLSDFLKHEGYDVVTADSGEQALKKLQHVTPELIILDMSMPGMGGVGFLKEISSPEGKPKYPVLVLTARANMAEFFANVDVDGFVAKPCAPSDLLMEVGRILFLRGSGSVEADGKRRDSARKILVGEDDKTVCRNLSSALSAQGYSVECASKGPEVLEKAIVGKPDVVVMKVVLPGMNGDVVARMMMEMPHTKGIPIILYDDSDSNLSEGKYVNARTGVKKFVKTNSPSSLAAAVKAVIG